MWISNCCYTEGGFFEHKRSDLATYYGIYIGSEDATDLRLSKKILAASDILLGIFVSICPRNHGL